MSFTLPTLIRFEYKSELSDSLKDSVEIDYPKRVVRVQIGNSAPIEHRPISMPHARRCDLSAHDFLTAAREGKL